MNSRGFTLIEVAIVMVIVGLLVGFGASLVVPLSTRAKRMETEQIVAAAMEAVVGFAASNNGRLPTTAQFSTVITQKNDAWQQAVCYVVDDRLTDGSTTTGDICTRKTTHMTVEQCSDAACTTPAAVSDVAFAIISQGGDFNNQTSVSRAVTGDTTIRVYGPGVGNVDNENGDFNRPEPYDDIVRWASLSELRNRIGCDGPQMTVLNTALPAGDVGTSYSAAVYPDGGVFFSSGGRYNWCIETPAGTAPPGLSFTNDTGAASVGFTTDGSALAESSGTWTQADYLLISGTPTTPGSYLITVWGRDNSNPGNDTACSSGANQDNCTEKSFVLTINP